MTAHDPISKRRYDNGPTAGCDKALIGGRWSMPLIREMLHGPRRFSQLKASLSGISANVLSRRLRELEAAAVLVRRKLPPPASVWVYELTPWGQRASPIFRAIDRWMRSKSSDDGGERCSVM